MRYAVLNGIRVLPARGGEVAACPLCGREVIAKCGSITAHHWAHKSVRECDTWYEPITDWHLAWQDLAAPENREVVIADPITNIKHRADIRTCQGSVIEVQHSHISEDEIEEREEFYGHRMLWIFDAREAFEKKRIRFTKRTENSDGSQYVIFRWKHPRKSLLACNRKVFLDLGESVIEVKPKNFHLFDDVIFSGRGNLFSRIEAETAIRHACGKMRVTNARDRAQEGGV